MKSVQIPIRDNLTLCAEDNSSSGYREICIGLMEDGVWKQDLAIVGQKYHYKDGNEEPSFDDGFTVKAFSLPYNEDFTHCFTIGEYKDRIFEWKDYDDKSGALYIDDSLFAKYDLVTGEIAMRGITYSTNDWLNVSVERVHAFVEAHV